MPVYLRMMSGSTLVTGAEGFIGRRLVARLSARGEQVTAWKRADADLLDEGAVAERLAQIKPARCFHLAGVSARQEGASWRPAAAEVQMLLNVARHLPGACTLIYSGSMAEYGRSGRFDENARCEPNTAYGFAKFAGTNQALALRALTGREVRVARLFGVYGPGERKPRLGPMLVSSLLAGQSVPLSDGKQIRDFVHVDDVCDCLMALTAEAVPPVLNVGTGVGITVREVCEAVAAELCADPQLLQFGALPRRDVDEDMLVADTTLLSKLGCVPPQRWHSREAIQEIVSDWISSAGVKPEHSAIK